MEPAPAITGQRRAQWTFRRIYAHKEGMMDNNDWRSYARRTLKRGDIVTYRPTAEEVLLIVLEVPMDDLSLKAIRCKSVFASDKHRQVFRGCYQFNVPNWQVVGHIDDLTGFEDDSRP